MIGMPRTILNGYLGLFAIDGLLQVIGMLSASAAPLVGLVHGLVLFATLVLALFWVVFARLPWRMLLPMILLAWQTGGLMPLPAMLLDLDAVGWATAASQLLLALVLVGFRPNRFPLTEEVLGKGPEVRLSVSAARAVVLVITMILGVYLQLIAMAASLDIITDGYAQVDRTGLSTAHRSCTKGETTVHLIGAVHIGEAKGYEDWLAGIPDGALLLAEGVTDEKGLLGERFGYGKLAKSLGLVPQGTTEVKKDTTPTATEEGTSTVVTTTTTTTGGTSTTVTTTTVTTTADTTPTVTTSTVTEETSSPASVPKGIHTEGRFRVLRADVDVNTFHKSTLELLRSVGTILNAEDPMLAYRQQVGEMDGVDEVTFRAAIEDVLHRRNEHLLGVLDEVLPREEVVVIPWGALHLRDVGRAVQADGFTCGEPRLIRMIEWSTVLSSLNSGRDDSEAAQQ